MASYNKVILVGNLTRDPEVRYTPGGTAVSDIGLAVNRSWFDKQSNSRREETSFFYVTLWGRQAEIAGEYLSKGRSVLIEGRLQMDQWDDRESGEKRSRLKIVGEDMQMLGSRGEGQRSEPRRTQAAPPSDQGYDGGGGSGGGGPDMSGPPPEQGFAPDMPSVAPPEDEVPF
jgi:single-strand DNA-binding protein